MNALPAVSFDISDWMQLDLSGSDARKFLHNFCTNEINKLQPGHGCEAFACDIKGKILAHFLVFALPHSLRLIAVPGTSERLLPHLRKYLLGAEVEMLERSGELGLLCACGAELPEILQTALGVEFSGAVDTCRVVADGDEELLLAGTDLLPGPAVLISGEREAVAALRERIPHELMAMGTPTLFQLLRIEAGFPWYGADINSENIAQEAARSSRAISFTKGCYLGQEPIARLDAMGHTNRELRGLVIDCESATAGDAVFAGEAEIGKLSSVSWSPLRQASVGLAMLRTAPLAQGISLQVRSAGGAADAEIYWPFPGKAGN